MSDPIVWLHDAQPDAEDAAYVVCAKGDPGCFPVFTGPQERGHGATTGSHHNTPTSVRELDLSRVVQHALLAGQKGVWWVDYDPTSNPAYQRIAECLEPKASGWRDIESAPKDGTKVRLLGSEGSGFGNYHTQGDTIFKGGWRMPGDMFRYPACGSNPTHWMPADEPLPPPPGEGDGDDIGTTDTIYQDAHRASVRSTIATSMKREEALLVGYARLAAAATKALKFVEAIETGGRDEGDNYAASDVAKGLRSALSPKEGSDD